MSCAKYLNGTKLFIHGTCENRHFQINKINQFAMRATCILNITVSFRSHFWIIEIWRSWLPLLLCWQRVVVKSCRKKTISWLTHMIYSGKDVFQVNAQTRCYYKWLISIIATAGKKFFDNLKSQEDNEYQVWNKYLALKSKKINLFEFLRILSQLKDDLTLVTNIIKMKTRGFHSL